jgi:hypothetical protein
VHGNNPSNPRRFATPDGEVKCLVIGAALGGDLAQLRDVLAASGRLERSNIVLFDADAASPDSGFLFHFDVVFAFTHFQFHSARTISESLALFLARRRGGIVIAYGCLRDDEWGCGEKELLERMPVSRGPRSCQQVMRMNIAPEAENGEGRELIKGVRETWIGGVFVRADVQLTSRGRLIAEYGDGVPFVAWAEIPGSTARIVVLNAYPVAPEQAGAYAVPSRELIASAVEFASGKKRSDQR